MQKYFVALNCLEKLTSLRFLQLLKHFANDAEKIWRANRAEWAMAGIKQEIVQEIWQMKEKIDPDEELKKVKKIGAQVLPITSMDYPQILREIYNPPPVLLIRGEFPLSADDFSVAIVGTRVATSYGRQVTTEFAHELAVAGVTIVSGLAAGLDAVAHRATLDVGGRTIAVFGCGVDQFYPSQNSRLAMEILQKGGALVSEYPLGTMPSAYTFPQRNRIIAGLSRGVLIVEGREKSGSLITAKLALESNREVFAIPGSIFSETSMGPNRLIQEGARAVLSASDIFETLNFQDLPKKIEIHKVFTSSPEEVAVLEALQKNPCHSDEITRKSGLAANEVVAILSLLEMKGLAKNLGGMNWVRS